MTECNSVRAATSLLRRSKPKVVIVRHILTDGYSDNVIAALANARLLPTTKVITLVAAGTSSSTEARQVALGADCVLRDPVRTEVLVEYLAKYWKTRMRLRPKGATVKPVKFAGGMLHATDRALLHRRKSAPLTPREVELAELLDQFRGEVVSYEMLYNDILGRKFRGDTSNMRVLLGKLRVSARVVGIALDRWIQVIPKLGYRYVDPVPGNHAR